MNPTSRDGRILQPSAIHVDHGGDPVVQLSPHKGLKNASILYQGIKDLPDGIQLRGGFDRQSKPCVYLHKRSPKKIGELRRTAITAATPVKGKGSHTVALRSPLSGTRTRIPAAPASRLGKNASARFITASNKEAERQEMTAFLMSIVDTVYASADPEPKLVRAAIELKLSAHAVREYGEEFTVGALRKPLRVIARAYALERLAQTTTPHRLVPTQGEGLRQKRLAVFASLGRDAQGELGKLMRAPKMSPYDTTPEIAVYEMKAMARAYVNQPADRRQPFRAFLRSYVVGTHLKYFARRWQLISLAPQSLERRRLGTESWATELDRICPIILEEERRHQRNAKVLPVHGSEGGSTGSLLYQRPSLTSLPPLPSTVGQQPAPSAPVMPPVAATGDLQGMTLPRQQVLGQPIVASLHEISDVPPDEALRARTRVTAHVTTNYSMIIPELQVGSLLADWPQSAVSSAADDPLRAPVAGSSGRTIEQSGSSFSSFIEIVRKFDETPGITYSSLALPTLGSEAASLSQVTTLSATQLSGVPDVSQTEVLSSSESRAETGSTRPVDANQ